MSIVGLVPAAGYARRLAGAVEGSKEVQPVRGRPVMEYLLDRLRVGGASRIIVTTRAEKIDVIAVARAAGAEVVIGSPPTLGASLGLAMRRLRGETVVLFGFPDTVWTPEDGFRPLVAQVESGEPIALGLFETAHAHRSDVTTVDAGGRLRRLDSRPAEPHGSVIWAAGAARAGTLRAMLAGDEPGDAFRRLTAVSPIATTRLGRVVDIGVPESLWAAASDPVFAAAGGPHDT